MEALVIFPSGHYERMDPTKVEEGWLQWKLRHTGPSSDLEAYAQDVEGESNPTAIKVLETLGFLYGDDRVGRVVVFGLTPQEVDDLKPVLEPCAGCRDNEPNQLGHSCLGF